MGTLEQVLKQLAELLKNGEQIDDTRITALCRAANSGQADVSKHISKKKLLPFYLKVRNEQPKRWAAWNIDAQTEGELLHALRAKPRRTASGVATITVITKPQPCTSNCLYCPNDMRMPKSYMANEPACRRAERNYFDPYLQVASRLFTLEQMGHVTDKIELIVLGGTWTEYPEPYQNWFMARMFQALNDSDALRRSAVAGLRSRYEQLGIPQSEEDCAAAVEGVQEQVNAGELNYNQAYQQLHDSHEAWQVLECYQRARMEDVLAQHEFNETAAHRVVGLVVETRPETLNEQVLTRLRRLGCTKVQIGVQSLSNEVLRLNHRAASVEHSARAFKLLRLFGFKIHSHFMANLPGSNLEQDRAEYRRFVSDAAFMPDEVKLYPCALIDGTGLMRLYQAGEWTPYEEENLIELLVDDVLATPAFTRVSRMIRDFSAQDIVAGSKKTNLRQMVEERLAQRGDAVQEIRFRELGCEQASLDELGMETVAYECDGSSERFLQWVTPEGRIAGFLRLSLPHANAVAELNDAPIALEEAMIREVHVYGKVAAIDSAGEAVQHAGLGRKLVEEACRLAREAGYKRINVISAVGTRGYYRKLGFMDGELYQTREL